MIFRAFVGCEVKLNSGWSRQISVNGGATVGKYELEDGMKHSIDHLHSILFTPRNVWAKVLAAASTGPGARARSPWL